jgi:hypothetical protein
MHAQHITLTGLTKFIAGCLLMIPDNRPYDELKKDRQSQAPELC